MASLSAAPWEVQLQEPVGHQRESQPQEWGQLPGIGAAEIEWVFVHSMAAQWRRAIEAALRV